MSVGGVAVVTGPDRVHVLLDLAHLDVERLRWHMLGIHATQRPAVRLALAALFVPLDGA